MQTSTKVVYSPKIQNAGKMSQKQLDAIAELKKYYPDLPKNLVIDGNLNLSDRYITMLPENLVVNGSLDLRCACRLEGLPNNLVVKGNIYLNCDFEMKYPEKMEVHGQLTFCNPSELPDNFTVGGDLVVIDRAAFLPDNLTVKGSLDLSKTKITELPSGLKVLGNLNLADLPIKVLPNDLYVGGTLNCNRTKLKNIPTTVFIGGGLEIDNTDIKVFPSQLKVINGDLSISESRIKYLPDGLKIKGSLYAEGSALMELPDNMEVDIWLNVTSSPINTWPNNLKAGDGIDFSHCPISSLPESLHVDGNLDIDHTEISELPDDLIVNGSLYLTDTLIKKLPTFLNAGYVSLYGGRLPSDVIPEGFSLTGKLNMWRLNSKDEGTYILPAGMKIGGDFEVSGNTITALPDDLYVGGNLVIGQNDQLQTLPSTMTVKGYVIIQSRFKNNLEFLMQILSGAVKVQYSVVIPRDELILLTRVLVRENVMDRIVDYPEDKSKVIILPFSEEKRDAANRTYAKKILAAVTEA